MKEVLRKIGLVDSFKMELPISRNDFVSTLATNIDAPGFKFFEAFSSSKNAYKGIVSYEGFELKRKRKLFDANKTLPTCRGVFRATDSKLIIEVEIDGFSKIMILFLIFLGLFYTIFVMIIIFNIWTAQWAGVVWMVPFVLLHAAFMIGVPYYVMKRSTGATKYELERDLYFMMKDKLNSVSQ
jgi:hypothetical protein